MSVAPKIDAFDDCLQRMLNGESLEIVLRRYPQWSDEFRPMLQAVVATRLLRTVHVPNASIARSRSRLLDAARARRQSKPTTRIFPQFKAGLMALVLILVLLFGGLSTIVVSAQTLPGDTLYPVKILSEQTRLFFTRDPSKRLKLERTYDQQRNREVDDLIAKARSEMVTFSGGLLKLDAELWLVDDIRVLIAPGTQVTGELRQGYYVGVKGFLQENGIVLAQKIWTREYEVKGELLKMSEAQWLVGGVSFTVGASTRIQGAPQVGDQVAVYLAMRPDGSLEAQTVTVTSVPSASAAVSVTPQPTATLQPSQTSAPVPSRTPRPTETEKPAEQGGSDDQNDDHETPDASKTPKPTDDEHDDDDDDHETPGYSETPRPTRTPRPTEHDDDHDETPEHDPTPTISGTPQPTQTPTQED